MLWILDEFLDFSTYPRILFRMFNLEDIDVVYNDEFIINGVDVVELVVVVIVVAIVDGEENENCIGTTVVVSLDLYS